LRAAPFPSIGAIDDRRFFHTRSKNLFWADSEKPDATTRTEIVGQSIKSLQILIGGNIDVRCDGNGSTVQKVEVGGL